jgi:hypothetical protein
MADRQAVGADCFTTVFHSGTAELVGVRGGEKLCHRSGAVLALRAG